MSTRRFVTSESVTEGHPDKMADQISDAILDEILRQDPKGRVACETLTTTGLVLVAGEVTTRARFDVPTIVRSVLREIGYTDASFGLDAESCSVLASLHEQSPDISQGVELSETSLGAGDQGLMYGYATNESNSPHLPPTDPRQPYMPLPILLAHRLARKLAEVRKNRSLPCLRPDGKSQVTIEYEDGKPRKAVAVVLAAQHDEEVDLDGLRRDLRRHVIEPVVQELVDLGVVGEGFLSSQTRIFINQTGRFVRGGPHADTGLTGRKIIVDTYGGAAPHGGGAFSGKDPTKVDRSASYGARWAAKSVVAAGLASRCLVQVAYCIGYSEPIALSVDTLGTGKVPDSEIESLVRKTFDFTPAGLIGSMNLRRPLYRKVATYGHFGRTDLELPWESFDKVEELGRGGGKV